MDTNAKYLDGIREVLLRGDAIGRQLLVPHLGDHRMIAKRVAAGYA
jgi:hypothetical protein